MGVQVEVQVKVRLEVQVEVQVEGQVGVQAEVQHCGRVDFFLRFTKECASETLVIRF